MIWYACTDKHLGETPTYQMKEHWSAGNELLRNFIFIYILFELLFLRNWAKSEKVIRVQKEGCQEFGYIIGYILYRIFCTI